ncbi:ABC transporter permease [Methylocella silvestris]|uniref:ABC transporter permease n=1 Tax=Methylocella silvestris TaxID=199596 RepID=UPI001FDF6C10|nr:ABC transporter permease subunit [Methylocella silvestris]
MTLAAPTRSASRVWRGISSFGGAATPHLLAALGLILFFTGWEIAARLNPSLSALIPMPSQIPRAWLDEISGGYWLAAVRNSLSHYLIGVAIGSILGVAFGLVCGVLPWFESLLAGLVRLLRPIPGLAWVPFAILWFGLSSTAAAFVIAIAVFWINFYAAFGAVQAIDRDLMEVARAFGHGGFFGRLFKIALPAATPGILAGVRTGLGQAWMSVVAAELFGVPGIGARMMQAASLLATDLVVVYMLTMALLYAITDILFVAVRRRLTAWQS